MPKTELIKFIDSLSPTEQERLTLHLTPVVKARKAYMDFVTIEIPADLDKLKDIETKRSTADKAALIALDRELAEIRKKIDGEVSTANHPRGAGWRLGGHTYKKVSLTDAFKKAKTDFASHY